jgi:hypothetical protein
MGKLLVARASFFILQVRIQCGEWLLQNQNEV